MHREREVSRLEQITRKHIDRNKKHTHIHTRIHTNRKREEERETMSK